MKRISIIFAAFWVFLVSSLSSQTAELDSLEVVLSETIVDSLRLKTLLMITDKMWRHDQDPDKGILPFEVRVGINSGQLVAGVVGTKKFQYDIWGNTVNVAARMEAASKPGMVNISESTYVQIQDYFECKYRGEIVIKNAGKRKMYFVLSSVT